MYLVWVKLKPLQWIKPASTGGAAGFSPPCSQGMGGLVECIHHKSGGFGGICFLNTPEPLEALFLRMWMRPEESRPPLCLPLWATLLFSILIRTRRNEERLGRDSVTLTIFSPACFVLLTMLSVPILSFYLLIRVSAGVKAG